MSEVQAFKEPALPWYTDQILPFDITLAAANEYGAAASCKIFGVELLNEGFGTSVDDSVLESQATYVARSVSPLQAVGRTSTAKRRNEAGLGALCGPKQSQPSRGRNTTHRLPTRLHLAGSRLLS